MLLIYILGGLLYFNITLTVTELYSSKINTLFNCLSPFSCETSMVIHMDEDIIFDGCWSFLLDPLLITPGRTLTFTSTNSKKLIISSQKTFDLSDLCAHGESTIIKGSAQLIFKQGSTLICKNNQLIIKDQAQLIFENEES